MSLLHARSKPDDTVPTSSMADIAFLLLVFFLVTTVFPRDQGLAVVLPQPSEVVDVSPKNLLRFVIDPSGRIELRRGGDDRGARIDLESVASIWRTEVASNPALIAVVQTDAEADYGAMVGVLDGLKQAQAQRISLQTLDAER